MQQSIVTPESIVGICERGTQDSGAGHREGFGEGFGPSYEQACDDYLLSLQAAGYSRLTIRNYRQILRRFGASCGRLAVTPSEVAAFLASLAVTPNVLSMYAGRLRQFFQHCVDNGWLPSNPAKAISRPRQRHKPIYAVPLEDVRRALEIATPRQYAIVMTLVTTGLRLGELACLRDGDVDWRRCRLTVRHGKGDRQRVVAVPQPDVLRPWVGCLTYRLIVRDLENLQRCSGVRIRAHLLRHTFAVECRRKGMPLEHLQKILGHSDISTTMVYLAYESQEDALDAQRRCAPRPKIAPERAHTAFSATGEGGTPLAMEARVSGRLPPQLPRTTM